MKQRSMVNTGDISAEIARLVHVLPKVLHTEIITLDRRMVFVGWLN